MSTAGGKSRLALIMNSAPDPDRLTQWASEAGCSCKLRPGEIASVLQELAAQSDPRILVGTDHWDDAAVYRETDEIAHVTTTDFFNPIVDDAFTFGAIAATNAISDIYAMGAVPRFALNVVGFPKKRLPARILEAILRGGIAKTKEAGIPILGGHSIELSEPVYGMVVHGVVHPMNVIRNKGLRAGDRLLLTKPLGTGVIVSALRRGKTLPSGVLESAVASMLRLNRNASECMVRTGVHAATDVTGFGFLGHLREMVMGSQVTVNINARNVPLLPGALDLVQSGVHPRAMKDNLQDAQGITRFAPGISETLQLMLADAQTSGGLLIGCPPDRAGELKRSIEKSGHAVSDVGQVVETGRPAIVIAE